MVGWLHGNVIGRGENDQSEKSLNTLTLHFVQGNYAGSRGGTALKKHEVKCITS